MTERINVGLEKVFFLHVLQEDPSQFLQVEPHYFKNDDIQFVYKVVRDEYLIRTKKEVPSPQQILAMVRLNDPEKKITDALLKSLLKGDNSEYDAKDWLLPRFKAWKLSNSVRNNIMKTVELIRGIEEINYDNVMDVTSKIKLLFNDMRIIDDTEDVGDDFDDVESHQINDSNKKIPTGWGCLDTVMGGGWDQSSLNVIMAQTSGGKSMFKQNMAVKCANMGYNCLYITLEMGKQKCFKRMGSMRLRIPIDQYDEKAKDTVFMKNKINSLRNTNGGMFNFTPGKIFVRKYSSSDCTVTDIDNLIHRLEEVKNIKINLVFVDYLNLMSLEKGLDFSNMLFLKGKHFAEGLRYIADKHNVAVITGTQTSKDIWDGNDAELKDIPESKAVAETADSVWAIIRNPLMKKNNKYRLKILKLRDGEHKSEQINFDFNPDFLLMENDEFVGTA